MTWPHAASNYYPPMVVTKLIEASRVGSPGSDERMAAIDRITYWIAETYPELINYEPATRTG